MSLPYQAKQFIKYTEQSLSLQCSICFSLDQRMLECQSACKQKICVECVTKFSLRTCVKQCSSFGESSLKMMRDLELEYRCPYGNQSCTAVIKSPFQFEKHLKECQFITLQSKVQIDNKQKFRCRIGHQLYYFHDNNFSQIFEGGDQYYTSQHSTCCYCLRQWHCKAVCLECGTGADKKIYCINCRPIPCDRKKCPLNHDLMQDTHFSYTRICDFCGIMALLEGRYSYSDRNCNFDICSGCYKNLPEKHSLIPLENIIPEKLRLKRERNLFNDSDEDYYFH